MFRSRFAALCFALLPAAAVAANKGPEYENLFQDFPRGYETAYQTRQGTMDMIEMVPVGESVERWTSMITVQIFHGLRAHSAAFQETLAKNFSTACRDTRATQIESGEEGGYPFSLWQHVCPLNPSTGQPEYLWAKTLEGNDAFYMVQFAFRHEPSAQDVAAAMEHLKKVRICDSRIAKQPCLPMDSTP